jgi:hypothetical protein
MTYNRLERGLAALLDAAPERGDSPRAVISASNYLLRGGRGDRLRLHADVSIERIAAGTAAELDPAHSNASSVISASRPGAPTAIDICSTAGCRDGRRSTFACIIAATVFRECWARLGPGIFNKAA